MKQRSDREEFGFGFGAPDSMGMNVNFRDEGEDSSGFGMGMTGFGGLSDNAGDSGLGNTGGDKFIY